LHDNLQRGTGGDYVNVHEGEESETLTQFIRGDFKVIPNRLRPEKQTSNQMERDANARRNSAHLPSVEDTQNARVGEFRLSVLASRFVRRDVVILWFCSIHLSRDRFIHAFTRHRAVREQFASTLKFTGGRDPVTGMSAKEIEVALAWNKRKAMEASKGADSGTQAVLNDMFASRREQKMKVWKATRMARKANLQEQRRLAKEEGEIGCKRFCDVYVCSLRVCGGEIGCERLTRTLAHACTHILTHILTCRSYLSLISAQRIAAERRRAMELAADRAALDGAVREEFEEYGRSSCMYVP
jgi:hypothetical protein